MPAKSECIQVRRIHLQYDASRSDIKGVCPWKNQLSIYQQLIKIGG